MATASLLEGGVVRAAWQIWGTSVTLLVGRPGALEEAVTILEEELAATDAACNRFSASSELSVLNQAGGRPTVVGPLLLGDLGAALAAAALTEGAVDPTVGGALVALGYDRDLDELQRSPASEPVTPAGPVPGWRSVRVDPARSTVELPAGAAIDLGSLAKARCADRAAERIHEETGAGALVDLGGDLRVAGPPPPGGWQVAVVDDARRGEESRRPVCVVSLFSGGLASSSTAVRTWERAGRRFHHIVDPATGWPARPHWRTVTVAAESCSLANTLSTAAVVWGEEALFRLPQAGVSARLVAAGGPVLEVGGWPRPDLVPPGPRSLRR